MSEAVSGDFRKQNRYFIASNGPSPARWRTDFLGEHGTQSGKVENRPQAFLAELDAHSSLLPHFHQIAQFQVMLAGSATLGSTAVRPVALRYADRHTPCERIDVGPHGLAVFMFRAQADPGALHMHKPESQQLLKPGRKRYVVLTDIPLSTEPVLQNRGDTSLEDLLEGTDCSDGLGALLLRMGADTRTSGPQPSVTSGQYFLVVNGSLVHHQTTLPLWSIIYVAPQDPPLAVCAGPHGAEVMILSFPDEQS